MPPFLYVTRFLSSQKLKLIETNLKTDMFTTMMPTKSREAFWGSKLIREDVVDMFELQCNNQIILEQRSLITISIYHEFVSLKCMQIMFNCIPSLIYLLDQAHFKHCVVLLTFEHQSFDKCNEHFCDCLVFNSVHFVFIHKFPCKILNNFQKFKVLVKVKKGGHQID